MIFHDERGNIINPQAELEKMKTDEFKRTHPNVPDYARPKSKKSKSPAIELANSIQKFLKLKGHHCSVVSTMGVYREGIGHTYGGATKGASDLSIIMKSDKGNVIAWECEIKIGKDIQSDKQKQYAESVMKAGGHYSIVKTYEQFISQYNILMST